MKVLIDSVIYSKIFNAPAAQNLAKRIQELSGKNFTDITSYANDAFGKQRYILKTDNRKNVETI